VPWGANGGIASRCNSKSHHPLVKEGRKEHHEAPAHFILNLDEMCHQD
jgi:hypothetical protein